MWPNLPPDCPEWDISHPCHHSRTLASSPFRKQSKGRKLNLASLPDTELKLGDRVLGEVEKSSFIALSGKGDHRE